MLVTLGTCPITIICIKHIATSKVQNVTISSFKKTNIESFTFIGYFYL